MQNPESGRRLPGRLAEILDVPELVAETWQERFQDDFIALLQEADDFLERADEGAEQHPLWRKFEARISRALHQNERLAAVDPIEYISNLHKAEQLLRAVSNCAIRGYAPRKTDQLFGRLKRQMSHDQSTNLDETIALPIATIMAQSGRLQDARGTIIPIADPAHYPDGMADGYYTEALSGRSSIWPLTADLCLLRASLTASGDRHDAIGDQHRASRALEYTAAYWRHRRMEPIAQIYDRINQQLPAILEAMTVARVETQAAKAAWQRLKKKQ